MTYRSILNAGIALAVLLPGQALAAPLTDEQVASLLDRLNQLEQEVQTLRSQLGQVQTKQVEQAEVVAEVKTSVKETADKVETTTVKWKGSPQLEDKKAGWSFKPRGRVQYDVATVEAPAGVTDPGLGFSNELRRVRLGAQGSIPGGFGYKVETDFAGGDFNLLDAYLSYKTGGLKIQVGQFNTFQGLEELSSSNDTSFIERAGYTDAFNFERRLGVGLIYKTGDILLQGGVFTDDDDSLNNDGNNSISFDGRVVFAPKINNTQLHFGANAHWRDLGDTVNTSRLRQRPLVHSTDIRFIDTGNIAGAEQETNFGLETAIISGRFHATAEAHWFNVTRTGFANPTFFGGAVEAGIFLTKDSRGYKSGTFKGVKVKEPVGSGGFGALQFNVRYDRLDLTNSGIVGGTQDSFQASLIWTPVDHIRFLINYGYLDYSDVIPALSAAGGDTDFGVNVLGARAQIVF